MKIQVFLVLHRVWTFRIRCKKEVTCDKVRKFIEDSSIDVLDIKYVSSVEARDCYFC